MSRAAYFGALTPEYTEVEYIESTQYQYIDTGFIPNQDTRVVAKLKCEKLGGGSANFIFGARQAAAKNAFQFFVSAYSPYEFTLGYNTKQIKFDSAANTSEPFIVDIDKNVATIGDYTASATYESFSCPVSMVLFGQNTNGTMTCGVTAIYWLKIYDNGTLVRDFVPYKKASGEACLYDRVSETFFFDSAGTAPFNVGAKISDSTMGDCSIVARKFKKVYMGDSGVARRAKKAYMGIGGVARPFYFPNLEYYGKLPNLAYQMYYGPCGLSAKSNALIFGGSEYNSSIEAYDKNLVLRRAPSGMQKYRTSPSAALADDIAIIAGGVDSGLIEAFADSLTRLSTNIYVQGGNKYKAGASTGSYAIFSGGTDADEDSPSGTAEAVSASLTRQTLSKYVSTSVSQAGVSLNGHAIFAGGRRISYVDSSSYVTYDQTAVLAYDNSLTSVSLAPTNEMGKLLGAARAGNYAIFFGGTAQGGLVVYDKSLTQVVKETSGDYKVYYTTGVTLGEYALFAGGYGISGSSYKNLDRVMVFDSSLTRHFGYRMKVARRRVAAASIGNFALIAGGEGNDGYDLEAFTV